MRVERDHEQFVAEHAEPAVDETAAGGQVGLQFAAVPPDLAPRARVDGPGDILWPGNVKDVVAEERGRFKIAERARLERPLWNQPIDIRRRNLGQRAMPLVAVIAPEREPARAVGRQAAENFLRCDERWRRLLCRQPSGAGRERKQQSEEKKSSIAHEPPLRSNCGIESAQVSEIAKQIVKIAVVEPVRSEDRHRRLRVVLHRFHLVLLVSLNPLARIHDLDREEVFVFLDALDRLPGRWCQRYRLESGAEAFGAAPDPPQNGLARARDPDARQIGSQTAAGALDAMTNGAVGAKDSFAVHGIAARRVGRGGSGQRAQVRSEEHTSELQSLTKLVCRPPPEKKTTTRPAPSTSADAVPAAAEAAAGALVPADQTRRTTSTLTAPSATPATTPHRY